MARNIKRRKTVMARSRKLGHCICDPGKGCPAMMFYRKISGEVFAKHEASQ